MRDGQVGQDDRKPGAPQCNQWLASGCATQRDATQCAARHWQGIAGVVDERVRRGREGYRDHSTIPVLRLSGSPHELLRYRLILS